MNVSETAYRVGFGSPSYFSKSFTAYFGYSPRDVSLNDEQRPVEIHQDKPVLTPRIRWHDILIPLVVYPNTRMILSLYYTGHIQEAISYAEDRLRMMKNYSLMDSYGFVLLNSGSYTAAIDVFHEIFNIENVRYPRILGWLGAAYARSGQTQEARQLLEELVELQKISNAGSPCFFAAVVHSALGKTDEALSFIRKSIDNHEMEVPWLISEPQFFDLHDHPDFEKMVEEVGFPGRAYGKEFRKFVS